METSASHHRPRVNPDAVGDDHVVQIDARVAPTSLCCASRECSSLSEQSCGSQTRVTTAQLAYISAESLDVIEKHLDRHVG
jgi:hypothetical protein